MLLSRALYILYSYYWLWAEGDFLPPPPNKAIVQGSFQLTENYILVTRKWESTLFAENISVLTS